MTILYADQINCETAFELMNVLSPVGREFALDDHEWWLFRGQANQWPIIASALRHGANLHEYLGASESNPKNYATQCFTEKAIIEKFFRLADRVGLALPEDSQLLRMDLSNHPDNISRSWPAPHLLSLMGLAQHYGLPTRLIDWTWNPYVAAYFAATSARKLIDSNKADKFDRIVISGLRQEVADSKFLDRAMNVKISEFTLSLVTAPTNGNVNLKAQEGVFLVVSPESPNASATYDWPDVMDLLSAAEPIRNEATTGMIMTFEATLPYKEVALLLHLLEKQGYSHSRIFPSYEGVVAQIKDEFK